MRDVCKRILITLLLSTLVISIQIEKKFKLTIYEAMECNYCKFASQEIKQLIKENHLQARIQVVVVDCIVKKSLCRGGKNKPLIVMHNDKKQKLGEIGGVRSKLYFRDWIFGFVRKNPIQTQRVKQDGKKYERLVIKNPEQVREFYKFEVQSQRRIREQKLDIIKQVIGSHQQDSQPSRMSNVETQLNQTAFILWNGLKQHNFRAQGIGLIVMIMVIGMFFICDRLKKKNGYKQVNVKSSNDQF